MKTLYRVLQKSLLMIAIAVTLVLPVSANAQNGITPAAPGPFKIFMPNVKASGQSQNPPQPTPTPKTPTPPPPTQTPQPPVNAKVYYLSPTGNDNNNGASEANAWATFDRAVNQNTAGNKLKPGDTLILLDGIYRQSLTPRYIGGQPGAYITIKAKNDGKAIIDGENMRIPVDFEDYLGATYYDIEGIIARNSSGSVFLIKTNNNIFRRVSGYNANTDDNQHVFLIWANNNLVEDCIVAGSGRKMFVIFASTNATGQHNTVRRCFASYRQWDGRDWHDEWPWNENFEVYSGDYNILENNIAYGYFANSGFSLLSQGTGDDNIGNKILGSIAILGGRDFQGNIINWGNIRPQPTQWDLIKDISNPAHRVGFLLWHGGNIQNNLLQDILAYGNASVGIGTIAETAGMANNLVNRATIYNNGLDHSYNGQVGIDAFQQDLARITVTNSRIDKIRSANYPYSLTGSITGEGARLQNRYIDGMLKDGSDGTPAQPLWPWPMEQRVRDELGISVTNLVSGIIPNQVSPITSVNKAYLTVSPVVFPFGNVKLGQPKANPITLKNTGTLPLTVSSYKLQNGSQNFNITSGGSCANPPFTLNPGQSCTVNVTFNPQDYKVHSDYVLFSSPDIAPYPGSPQVYVSGLGYSTASAIQLPGKQEAEAFTNSFGTFEVKPTSDAGGSGKIGGIDAGAWLEYPVNFAKSGTYTLTARVASIHTIPSVSFSVAIDGTTKATINPPDTGGWENFTDVTVSNISISAGTHTVRINLTTGSFDLDYLTFSSP